MKLIITTIALILITIGCVTTKDKSYTSDTSVNSKDSLVSFIEDSIRKVYEEKYKEVGFYIDFYQTSKEESDQLIGQMQDAIFDSSIAADSLRNMIKNYKCPESTVKYNADGSVEVKGKIKNLSAKVLDLQKSLDSARKVTENKADVKIRDIKSTVTITKTKKVYPYWWFLLVLFVLGFISGYVVRGKFPPTFLKEKIKTILPWV